VDPALALQYLTAGPPARLDYGPALLPKGSTKTAGEAGRADCCGVGTGNKCNEWLAGWAATGGVSCCCALLAVASL
jgi:hypothetical protein